VFQIIAAFIAAFNFPISPVPLTVDHGLGLLGRLRISE